MELTAKGGGSFLKLDPSGVTLSGPGIKINSGGSPGRRREYRHQAPRAAGAADSDSAGAHNTPVTGQRANQFGTSGAINWRSRCPICESCREGVCSRMIDNKPINHRGMDG